MTKILVIEDVHYLRNDVLEMLKFEGFDVRGAENGAIGVQVAQEYLPDLIVCDIMMPELDGFGVLEKLRAENATKTIPFIFLTAKTDRFDLRQGMGMGADDYVTKPFLTNELLDTIRARLEKRKFYADLTETALSELRNAITTSLPHELRTPLNTIIGFSDILILEAHQVKPEQVLEWSQHINMAALRLYRLVENYLTYVRIETLARDDARLNDARTKVTQSPANVIEFQAMLRAQQSNREPDLQLSVVDSSAVAIGEPDLTKIVDELMENAFKYSDQKTPVTICAEVMGSDYQISISDQGRGMTPEQINNIGAFLQFERYLYEQQGTGLGMVIAKRLVELHYGTIEIKSELQHGTTVTIKLPLAMQHAG